MENQAQVKAPTASEPMGTWINGIIMTTMNMGVEVGKTMLRNSQVIDKLSKDYKELEKYYDDLCVARIKVENDLKEANLEITCLADEKKVLETELVHLKNYIAKVTGKNATQLELPLGDITNEGT